MVVRNEQATRTAAGWAPGPAIVLLRPHQWIKNAFVAAPLFFTPKLATAENVLLVAAGVLCFCALSSAVYVVNDYIDRNADRHHPTKRTRPLAAGTVSTRTAFVLLVLLLVLGLSGAALLSPYFLAICVGYLGLNLAYSSGLKQVSILDVMIIALGFVLRVEAGAALIGTEPTVWIIVCTGLLALFLALAKRRDDLVKALPGDHRRSLDGYNRSFLDASVTIVLAALVVSYTIYTVDPLVMRRMGSEHLYLTVPFVLAGMLRYLQITLVEERSGSPTRIILSDRFMIGSVLGWVATFGVILY